uniref:Putative ribosome bioproteinsis protein n=1 Tax=Panstrongylus megistus TaxID=65343 RepID=A0A069DUQ8_9HEMI
MLVLFETAAGYAIFKLLDAKKLSKTENLYNDFQSPESASQIVKLKHFEKFSDTTQALAATAAAVDGKLNKILKKALKKVFKETQDELLIADAKLGNAIKEKFSVSCISNNNVQELLRCIRSQAESLLSGLPQKEMAAMALGLAHSLSRYKLKFSPEKVDLMIVQAISLLDELDKELNNYIMRCREWYGWHFPELGKILTDNVVFVKVIKLIGTRENTASTDLSDILPEDVEEKVKEAAELSMGTEISEDDILNIQKLCDQVLEISNYRGQLYEYLKSRMMTIAPNVTILLGELVGARLISHAGSLLNLAKQPASTVQILGAEKALFRALKTHKDTPKYGLIYSSSLIASASVRNKGKISRSLAAKTALACRFDALGDSADTNPELGIGHRAKLETRLRMLEEGNLRKISGTAKAKAKFEKYHVKKEVLHYPPGNDMTIPVNQKRKLEDVKPSIEELAIEGVTETPPKKKKKVKQEIKVEDDVEDEVELIELATEENDERPIKKKKKKQRNSSISETIIPTADDDNQDPCEEEVPIEKKKKKKKKSLQQEM